MAWHKNNNLYSDSTQGQISNWGFRLWHNAGWTGRPIRYFRCTECGAFMELWLTGKQRSTVTKSMSQCHFVFHNSYMDCPGIDLCLYGEKVCLTTWVTAWLHKMYSQLSKLLEGRKSITGKHWWTKWSSIKLTHIVNHNLLNCNFSD